MLPWDIRIPVDPDDYSTLSHWQTQKQTNLFNKMFDWNLHVHHHHTEEDTSKLPPPTASLHPYLSFGSPSSPFFAPWQDVGN
eukprot:158681-Ditylum_brightwellii.AAC.1